MIDLEKKGDVFVLTMNAEDNRLNRTFLDAFHGAVDEVEASEGPAALVTTGGVEKFYSNGLDLEWMGTQSDADNQAFVGDLIGLFARLLALPIPSVAAITGHAFAGGAMLALAHDFRVMRADRGYFCLPEVDIRIPLVAGMTALITERLSGSTLRDAVLSGSRFSGEEAARRGIVDEALPLDQVVSRATEIAGAHAAKHRGTYGALKRSLYHDALHIMEKKPL